MKGFKLKKKKKNKDLQCIHICIEPNELYQSSPAEPESWREENSASLPRNTQTLHSNVSQTTQNSSPPRSAKPVRTLHQIPKNKNNNKKKKI